MVFIGSPKLGSGQSGSSGFDPRADEARLCLLERHFDMEFIIKTQKRCRVLWL